MKIKYILSLASICALMTACSDNTLNEQHNILNSDEPIMLSASINESFSTKAEEAEAYPAEGNYSFSYIDKESLKNYYSHIKLYFNKEGKCTPEDLTWGDIKTNVSNSVFALDNVEKNDGENTTISLDKSYIAKASEGDGEGNDILWDAVLVQEQSQLDGTHFELKHCMSKLTFVISSVNDEIKNLLKNGNIEVKLWNVVTTPKTFNIITGMVSNDGKKILEDSAKELKISDTPVDEGTTVTVNTESWIFPPQTFQVTGNSNERPHLKIILTSKDETNPKELTFTGPLLESMLYEGQYIPLEFKSGFHLIVNVDLGTQSEYSIQFRPVLVKRWKDYTPKQIAANQVGVYTKEELEELVEAYNEDPSDKNLILWKYGVLNSDSEAQTWTFSLWKNISGYHIDNTDGNLGFKTNKTPGFKFISNGHKVNGKTVDENGILNNPQTIE